MLFLQGTRDTLADLSEIQPVIDRLGPARRSSYSTMPIIRSMCPPAAANGTPR